LSVTTILKALATARPTPAAPAVKVSALPSAPAAATSPSEAVSPKPGRRASTSSVDRDFAPTDVLGVDDGSLDDVWSLMPTAATAIAKLEKATQKLHKVAHVAASVAPKVDLNKLLLASEEADGDGNSTPRVAKKPSSSPAKMTTAQPTASVAAASAFAPEDATVPVAAPSELPTPPVVLPPIQAAEVIAPQPDESQAAAAVVAKKEGSSLPNKNKSGFGGLFRNMFSSSSKAAPSLPPPVPAVAPPKQAPPARPFPKELLEKAGISLPDVTSATPWQPAAAAQTLALPSPADTEGSGRGRRPLAPPTGRVARRRSVERVDEDAEYVDRDGAENVSYHQNYAAALPSSARGGASRHLTSAAGRPGAASFFGSQAQSGKSPRQPQQDATTRNILKKRIPAAAVSEDVRTMTDRGSSVQNMGDQRVTAPITYLGLAACGLLGSMRTTDALIKCVEKNKVLRCIDLRNNALASEAGSRLLIAFTYRTKTLQAIRVEGNPRVRLMHRRKIALALRKVKFSNAGEVALAHLAQLLRAKDMESAQPANALAGSTPATSASTATAVKPWAKSLKDLLAGRHISTKPLAIAATARSATNATTARLTSSTGVSLNASASQRTSSAVTTSRTQSRGWKRVKDNEGHGYSSSSSSAPSSISSGDDDNGEQPKRRQSGPNFTSSSDGEEIGVDDQPGESYQPTELSSSSDSLYSGSEGDSQRGEEEEYAIYTSASQSEEALDVSGHMRRARKRLGTVDDNRPTAKVSITALFASPLIFTLRDGCIPLEKLPQQETEKEILLGIANAPLSPRALLLSSSRVVTGDGATADTAQVLATTVQADLHTTVTTAPLTATSLQAGLQELLFAAQAAAEGAAPVRVGVDTADSGSEVATTTASGHLQQSLTTVLHLSTHAGLDWLASEAEEEVGATKAISRSDIRALMSLHSAPTAGAGSIKPSTLPVGRTTTLPAQEGVITSMHAPEAGTSASRQALAFAARLEKDSEPIPCLAILAFCRSRWLADILAERIMNPQEQGAAAGLSSPSKAGKCAIICTSSSADISDTAVTVFLKTFYGQLFASPSSAVASSESKDFTSTSVVASFGDSGLTSHVPLLSSWSRDEICSAFLFAVTKVAVSYANARDTSESPFGNAADAPTGAREAAKFLLVVPGVVESAPRNDHENGDGDGLSGVSSSGDAIWSVLAARPVFQAANAAEGDSPATQRVTRYCLYTQEVKTVENSENASVTTTNDEALVHAEKEVVVSRRPVSSFVFWPKPSVERDDRRRASALALHQFELSQTIKQLWRIKMASALPALPRYFTGRNIAMADLFRELRQFRFITLTGTKQVGKSALAISAAHLLLERSNLAAIHRWGGMRSVTNGGAEAASAVLAAYSAFQMRQEKELFPSGIFYVDLASLEFVLPFLPPARSTSEESSTPGDDTPAAPSAPAVSDFISSSGLVFSAPALEFSIGTPRPGGATPKVLLEGGGSDALEEPVTPADPNDFLASYLASFAQPAPVPATSTAVSGPVPAGGNGGAGATAAGPSGGTSKPGPSGRSYLKWCVGTAILDVLSGELDEQLETITTAVQEEEANEEDEKKKEQHAKPELAPLKDRARSTASGDRKASSTEEPLSLDDKLASVAAKQVQVLNALNSTSSPQSSELRSASKGGAKKLLGKTLLILDNADEALRTLQGIYDAHLSHLDVGIARNASDGMAVMAGAGGGRAAPSKPSFAQYLQPDFSLLDALYSGGGGPIYGSSSSPAASSAGVPSSGSTAISASAGADAREEKQAVIALRAVIELILNRAPHITILVTSNLPLGKTKYVNECEQYVPPLDAEDAAVLLGVTVGAATRTSGLTMEQAIELVSGCGKIPGNVLELAATLRGCSKVHR
jgi:hypothetical protein